MSDILIFNGFIKDVQYHACLTSKLTSYPLSRFDINTAKTYGIIEFDGGQIAYSKWVSPKRTRSYPFERIYNTYNSSKILTVIPVLKDEGHDGDSDRIQYSTISWMNLLNVYIVLAYYESAEKNRSPKQCNRHKLTKQKLNVQLVNSQISEIIKYKQSALHWNRSLFEDKFTEVYQKAIDSYELISEKNQVRVHSCESKQEYLAKIKADYQQFKDISLKGSQGAAVREAKTLHKLEYLNDGFKSIFYIHNYLGGVYHLTADEIVYENGKYIIQESKNSVKNFFPAISDIKDGLFKLILFANIDSLQLNHVSINFSTKLKLTGCGIKGSILFPCSDKEFQNFLYDNSHHVKNKHKEILQKLRLEAKHNKNLTIEVGGCL
jgi:predicted small lipoprotein YifL